MKKPRWRSYQKSNLCGIDDFVYEFDHPLLPRPYPTFLPYWYESHPSIEPIKCFKVESVQIAIPLPEPGKELNNYGIKIKEISQIKGVYE